MTELHLYKAQYHVRIETLLMHCILLMQKNGMIVEDIEG